MRNAIMVDPALPWDDCRFAPSEIGARRSGLSVKSERRGFPSAAVLVRPGASRLRGKPLENLRQQRDSGYLARRRKSGSVFAHGTFLDRASDVDRDLDSDEQRGPS
jgi:hypothetical protein